jgi:hypothetical protein
VNDIVCLHPFSCDEVHHFPPKFTAFKMLQVCAQDYERSSSRVHALLLERAVIKTRTSWRVLYVFTIMKLDRSPAASWIHYPSASDYVRKLSSQILRV